MFHRQRLPATSPPRVCRRGPLRRTYLLILAPLFALSLAAVPATGLAQNHVDATQGNPSVAGNLEDTVVVGHARGALSRVGFAKVGGAGDLPPGELTPVDTTDYLRCYEQRLRLLPQSGVWIYVLFTINSTGRVTQARPAEETGDMPVSRCIIYHLRHRRFAPPSGGPLNARYSFFFQPAAPPPQAPEDGPVTTAPPAPRSSATWYGDHTVDFGVLDSNGSSCQDSGSGDWDWVTEGQPRDLPGQLWLDDRAYAMWVSHPWSEPRHRGPSVHLNDICLRADYWAHPLPRQTLLLKLHYSAPMSALEGTHDLPVIFAVRRHVGLGHVLSIVWFPLILAFVGLRRRARGLRLQKGAQIAWMLNLPVGYRDGAPPEWRFSPFDTMAGARPSLWRHCAVALDRELDDDGRIPAIAIEPAERDDEVVVHSAAPLIVKALDERHARVEGHTAVVTYGSVVRVGPLVFAPLYAEQVYSVKKGLMALEATGGEMGDRASLVPAVRWRTRNPKLAPLGWLGFFAALTAVGFVSALFGPWTTWAAGTFFALANMTIAAFVGLKLIAKLLPATPPGADKDESTA